MLTLKTSAHLRELVASAELPTLPERMSLPAMMDYYRDVLLRIDRCPALLENVLVPLPLLTAATALASGLGALQARPRDHAYAASFNAHPEGAKLHRLNAWLTGQVVPRADLLWAERD